MLCHVLCLIFCEAKMGAESPRSRAASSLPLTEARGLPVPRGTESPSQARAVCQQVSCQHVQILDWTLV